LNPKATRPVVIDPHGLRLLFSLLMVLVLAGCGGGDGNDPGGSSGDGPQDSAEPGGNTDGSESGDHAGGDDGGEGSDETSTAFRDACRDLQWARTSVRPMAGIRITGLMEPLKGMVANPQMGLRARVRVDGEVVGAMPVKRLTRDEASGLQVIAPAHPDGPFQGGTLELILEIGGQQCGAKPVSVAGLDEPSDPRRVIDDSLTQLETLLLNQARVYGYTSLRELLNKRDAIRDQGEGFAVPELWLVTAADGLANLEALVAPDALDTEAEKLLAALLQQIGTTGFPSGLSGLNQALSTRLPPVDPTQDLPAATVVNTESGGFTTARAPGQGGAGSCAAAVIGEPLAIDSARELDRYMTQQKKWAVEANSTGDAALDLVAGVLPFAGLAAGGVGSAVGVGASAMIYVYKLIQDITINTLPSRFDRVDIRLVPGPRFPEDYAQTNPEPLWGQARASVSSNGMSLTPQVIGAALQVFGAGKWAGSLGRQTSVFEDIRTALDDKGLLKVSSILNNLLEDSPSDFDCMQVEPWTWSGIDITDARYTEATFIGNNVVLNQASGDVNTQTLVPNRTGSGTLIVETRDDRFGGRPGEVRQSITVEKIALLPTPTPYWEDNPGNTKTFEVGLAPPDVALPGKPIEATLVNGGGQKVQDVIYRDPRHDFRIRTPTDAEDYPVVIQLTRQGALPDPTGRTLRTAQVTIRNDASVALTPDDRCIGRNEALDLTAEVRGVANLEPGRLDWTLTQGAGTLAPGTASGSSQPATYTAPGTTTEAVVEAEYTPTSGQAVHDRSRIAVGACDARVHIDGGFRLDADAGTESEDYDSDTDAFDIRDLPEPGTAPNSNRAWRGRTEGFTARVAANDRVDTQCTETAERDDSPTGETCVAYAEAGLTGSGQGSASIGADADGQVTFDLQLSGQSACLAADDRYGRSGDTACSGVDGGAGWQVGYYLTLDEATTQRVRVEVTCREQADGLGAVYLGIAGLRWPANGGGYGQVPFLPLEIASLQSFQEAIRDGTLDPSGLGQVEPVNSPLGTACGTDGAATYTQTFDIPAPAQPGRTETGFIQIAVGTAGGILTTPRKEAARDLIQTGAQGNLGTLPQSQPGSYRGAVDLHGEIRVESVNGAGS